LKTTVRLAAISYDANLTNVSSVARPFGHVMSFTYDGNGHVATMTTPDGDVYSYT